MATPTPQTGPAFPLTHSQTWVWAGQRLLPDSPMNNMAFAFHLREPLDVEAFTAAVGQLLQSCDAMHLRVNNTGEKPSVTFADSTAYELPLLDFSHEATPNDQLTTWLATASARPFALTGQLWDTALIKITDQHYVWYLNQHHLITDGWSKALQVRWVMAAYDALRQGLPVPETGFAAFADYLAAPPAATAEARQHWEEKARQLPAPARLFGRGNPDRTSRSNRQTVTLSAAQMARLEAVCQEPEVRNWSADLARFTVLATAFFAYLYRISGQTEITIGTPAHNRVTPAHKRTPGMFIELFPQSVTIAPGETFATLLQKVKAESMEFLRHAKPGSGTREMNQTFNVLLNYINQSFFAEAREGFASEWLHSGHTEPGHHLSLQIFDFDATGRLTLSFDGNNAVVEPDVMALVPGQFLEVLDTLLADRSLPLNPLRTRVRAEKSDPASNARIQQFNTTDKSYPQEKTVVDLFYAAADRHADRVAIVAGDQQLTFAELDHRSNQLANHLLAAGLAPETPVAICIDRSLEMMVGLLGIMKAGGAYVPIDPAYPALRIGYLLEDVNANWLLTTAAHREKLSPLHAGNMLLLDADWPAISEAPDSAPSYRPRPDNLVYIIHTSGSTGRPKGVMNQHNGPMNRLLWSIDALSLDPDTDVILQKTTFCFDVSFWEIFCPMVAGVKLVFARPDGHKDDRYLREVMREHAITVTHFVPPMLELFLEQAENLPTLRAILTSGEALKPHQVNTTLKKLPQVTLHNLYGPTEAGIDVTHWRAPHEPVRHVPIGRPLPNAPIYILDETGGMCPIGVPGELFIGGIPVARGYYGKPELTAERFVTRRIYAEAEPERLYRTGDLARWLPDGNIDFLGRIDGQVKVRGYRIELGEIESVLLELPEVARTQVLARDEGRGSYLAAYVVAAGDFSVAAAQDYLAERLPEYMVPAHFIVLDDFPLNSNGKLDRAALPAPNRSGRPVSYEPPAGEFEEMIHEVWRETLGLEKISVTTSFHDLGGHSLSAIRLINRINEAFELDLAANTIFRFPTIRGLAGYIEAVIRQLLEEMNAE